MFRGLSSRRISSKIQFCLLCVCMCVWTIWKDVKLLISAGGQPRVHSWLPNEEGYATTDMESDQLHVPASILDMGRG